jgi:XapX domain-containing protein
MFGAFVSLLMGVAVGIAYGLIGVRSPAPPLIALIGLLGMVAGEQLTITARRYIAPPAHSATQQLPESAARLAGPHVGPKP